MNLSKRETKKNTNTNKIPEEKENEPDLRKSNEESLGPIINIRTSKDDIEISTPKSRKQSKTNKRTKKRPKSELFSSGKKNIQQYNEGLVPLIELDEV